MAYHFFSWTDSTDSPDCLPILLSISVFSLYSSCLLLHAVLQCAVLHRRPCCGARRHAAVDRWHRQTDGRTDTYRCIDSAANYASSSNNVTVTCFQYMCMFSGSFWSKRRSRRNGKIIVSNF